MGKSQETFSKKEKEKKRLKKRLEKQQKKDDRKENKAKVSFDDMIAYVDENGNLSNTPPDPTKKNKVNSEDMQISISRREDLPEDNIRRGVITFYNDAKGFGFIRDLDTKESIFVHANGLMQAIKENNKVTFETEKGPKGLNAIKVKL